MKKTAIITILILAAAGSLFADSQFNSNGLGVSTIQSNARGWGMGGLSISLPDTLRVSFVNPALAAGMREVSYSLLYTADSREVSSDSESFRYNASTFPFFAFLVPFGGRYSLGFGYNLEQDISTARTNSGIVRASGDIPEYTRFFKRNGSIFRVPAVAAVRLFHNVRIGFRLDSYFGNVDEEYQIDFNDPDVEDSEEKLKIGGSGTAVAFGAVVPIKEFATVGAAWTAAVKLEGHRRREYENGQLAREEFSVGVPERLAFGLTLSPGWGWTVAGEVAQIRWSDVGDTLVSPGGYNDVTRYSFGLERFNPGKRWYSRFPIRLGGQISSLSYLDRSGASIDRQSLTVGSGFRLGKGRGRCDWALEYGRIGDQGENGLEEKYYRVVIGVSGQEPWKRRKSYIH